MASVSPQFKHFRLVFFWQLGHVTIIMPLFVVQT
jgi:hypothetical protein